MCTNRSNISVGGAFVHPANIVGETDLLLPNMTAASDIIGSIHMLAFQT